jgi:hypothetical protein
LISSLVVEISCRSLMMDNGHYKSLLFGKIGN